MESKAGGVNGKKKNVDFSTNGIGEEGGDIVLKDMLRYGQVLMMVTAGRAGPRMRTARRLH